MLSRRRLFALVAIIVLAVGGLIYLYWLTNRPENLKNLIVLLEDPEDNVGQLAVTAGGGGVVLTKTHQATGVSSNAEPLRPPFIMTDEEIGRIFGDVLKSRPGLPVSVTLNFQPGVSILASAGPQIDRIVAEAQRRPVYRLSIYGYASPTGSAVGNLGIALLRARSVGRALASRGLDPNRFDIHSLLDPQAAGPAPGGASAPDNRRVEIIIR